MSNPEQAAISSTGRRRATGRRGAARLAAVLLAVLGGLVLAGTALAGPQVEVRVTIEGIRALDCIEDVEVGPCTGAADFYAIVSFDGQEEPREGPIDDKNTIQPNWTFSRSFDVERGRIPVTIEIRDEDGGTRGADDHVDVDPTNGGNERNLDLQVNLAPCIVFGDATPQCSRSFGIEGSADDDRAELRFTVEVVDADSDGDGLQNNWESRGLDTDGNGAVDVDLPKMGANPMRRDIFVEIDCLRDDGNGNGSFADAVDHTHCPQQLAMQDVVAAFARAPVFNADGTTGIQLHLDTGSLYGAGVVTPVNGAAGAVGSYGDLGAPTNGAAGGVGGNQITETSANRVVDWDGATGDPAENFYDLKGTWFNARRAAAFHYALFVHQVNAGQPANDCTSGWAEGGFQPSSNTITSGNDLIVSLGGLRDVDGDGSGDAPCWGDGPVNGLDDDGDGATDEDVVNGTDDDGDCPTNNDADGDGQICDNGDVGVDEDGGYSVGSRGEQAGTFMHELGHNLGLDHGGGDDDNDKPNYLSVMNYSFQQCNVRMVPGRLPGGCDYSWDDLPDLVESSLDECRGLDGGVYGLGPSNWSRNTVDGTPTGAARFEGATCPAPDQTNVMGDINTDGSQTTLVGYDDWAAIVYAFQDSGAFADGTAGNPAEDEPTPQSVERAQANLSRLLAPAVSVDKSGPADAEPGDTLTYTLATANRGAGPAFAVGLTDTKPDGAKASFDLGIVAARGTASRTVTYDVPCTATDGSVLTNTATVRAVDIVGFAESTPGDNTDTVQTTVHAPVLTASKTATATVNAGEAIVYTITYANTGSGDAADVVLTDTLPAGTYYSTALDGGAGPQPTSVVRNADGTTTLRWAVGALAAASGPRVVSYTARPSLLSLAGETVTNAVSLTFTNANGCTYAPVTASATSTIGVVPPSRDPLTVGYWRNHPAQWTAETLARIQSTDQRFDGADGSTPDGRLDGAELTAALAPASASRVVLAQQLLAAYFNLAERRVNAGTAIASRTAERLGLANIRAAGLYGIETLALPVDTNRDRYSDATQVLDEVNRNRSEVYG